MVDEHAEKVSVELELAANGVSQAALSRAIEGIHLRCEEMIENLRVLERSFLTKTNDVEMLGKMVSITSLYILGYLPVRPDTCPFCQEFADARCHECGYAKTHGGICNTDGSIFVRFIESLQEIGFSLVRPFSLDPAFYGQPDETEIKLDEVSSSILSLIKGSIEVTESFEEMLERLDPNREGSVRKLMEIKARYIRDMIELLPLDYLSNDVVIIQKELLRYVDLYW